MNTEADKNCSICLVANKLDLVEQNPAMRRVELGEAKRYAATIGAAVFEVSARTGVNVSEAFTNVTNACFERAARGGREVGVQREARRLTRLEAPQAEKKGCC